MTAWPAEEQGIAVGTGFGVLIGNWVGIFNITTPPIIAGVDTAER
jgi:hypothetical protein